MSHTYQREAVLSTLEELLRLVPDHYLEADTTDLPLKPAVEAYLEAEARGILRLYTVRAAGELVGYSLFSVLPHPHHGDLVASQDLLFIQVAQRGTGHRFIAWCDEQLRAEGVKLVFHYVTVRKDFGKILTRLGYSKAADLYLRRL